MSNLAAYVTALMILATVDFVWLGLVAKKFYRQEIGGLLRAKPHMQAAVSFYLIYALGVVLFAVQPSEALSDASLKGLLLGIIAYGTYDLTNLAVVKGFSARVAVVDIVWGALMTTVVASGAYAAAQLVT